MKRRTGGFVGRHIVELPYREPRFRGLVIDWEEWRDRPVIDLHTIGRGWGPTLFDLAERGRGWNGNLRGGVRATVARVREAARERA